MKIVALLAVRNEHLYLERCLLHLADQGIKALVIDNESTDESLRIAKSFSDEVVVDILNHPYEGFYDWAGLLKKKQELAATVEADWFIHHDADEIRFSNEGPGETLHDAIERIDKNGFNAINFDEFVFVPTPDDNCHEGKNYVETMRSYYYFASAPLRRVNAWKRQDLEVDLLSSGGHRVQFPGISISPHNFTLCHYPCLSPFHSESKYINRVYSHAEVARGWHRQRVRWKNYRFCFPPKEFTRHVYESRIMDRSAPSPIHLFMEKIS